MKRAAFYKNYYEITDRSFSDHIIWGEKEREEAWRKGQTNMPKIQRKIYLILQYVTLLLCWIPLLFEQSNWHIIPIAVIISILFSYLTNFSIIRIEALYRLYRKDSVYCRILQMIFLGKFDFRLALLTKSTKKYVGGFLHKSGYQFYGKYLALCKNPKKQLLLIFKPDCVTIKVNGKKYKLKNEYYSIEGLFSDLSDIITRELSA